MGRFELCERLGAGAFGVVYRAHDPVLNRSVAVKLPAAGVFATDEIKARSVREAQAAARLRHPHIVPVFEAGFDGQRFFVASAFIAGKTLRAAVTAGGFNCRRAAEIARKLAGALQCAHDQGIVHRDVKPANVMLDEQGEPQLMDFGLAHLADASAQLTTEGSLLGTPAYMSPEQAGAPLGPIGPASDQYSLGASLYEMLTGKLPFEGPPMLVLYQVRTAAPAPPRSLRAEIPQPLEAICMRAMARKPEDRFASCAEFSAALDRWLRMGDTTALPIALEVRPETQRTGESAGITATRPAPRSIAPPPPLPVSPSPALPAAPSIAAASPAPAPVRRSFFAWVCGVALVAALMYFCGWLGKLAWQAVFDDGGNAPPGNLSRYTPGELIQNSLGMQLVLIPSGQFVMGSPGDEIGRHLDETQHEVRISQPFYLGVFEVTQAEFEQLGGTKTSYFSAEGGGHEQVVGRDTRRHPVERVSWEVAVQFCQLLTARPEEQAAGRVYALPTEAQWEYACRAGSTTAFHNARAINGREANINGHGGYGTLESGPYLARTVPVGSYAPNAFGLYDMHGNVWEWCQDTYGPYARGLATDPTGPATGESHVVRGGSWYHGASSARSAHRGTGSGTSGHTLGFRVAATLINQ